jgi:hypothetical protein
VGRPGRRQLAAAAGRDARDEVCGRRREIAGRTGNSVDGSACNNWQISLYLVPYGTTYVMTAAPGDYHAVHSDC